MKGVKTTIGPMTKESLNIYNNLDKNIYDKLYNVYLLLISCFTYTNYSRSFEFYDFFKVLVFYQSSSLTRARQALFNSYSIGVEKAVFNECMVDANEILENKQKNITELLQNEV